MTSVYTQLKSSSTVLLSFLPLGDTLLKGKWTQEFGRTNRTKDEGLVFLQGFLWNRVQMGFPRIGFNSQFWGVSVFWQRRIFVQTHQNHLWFYNSHLSYVHLVSMLWICTSHLYNSSKFKSFPSPVYREVCFGCVKHRRCLYKICNGNQEVLNFQVGAALLDF